MKERLTLPELSAAINVEEHTKASGSDGKAPIQAHQVQVKNIGGNGKDKGKKPQNQNKPNGKQIKKKKENFVCYVCGVVGHKANHYRNRKGKGPSPAQHSNGVKVVDPS